MLQEITQRSPKDIIAKALYSKILGFHRSDDTNGFGLDDTQDLSSLLSRFMFYCPQPPGLRSVDDFKDLRKEFAVALRHRKDYTDLCLEVTKQALEKGIPYAVYGVSPAARLLKTICKEVVVEVNRAKSLRFHPHPEDYSIYWAEYNIVHNTADIIFKYFAKRYPMYTLIIYSRREAYWFKDNQVFCQELREFSLVSVDPKHEQPSYYRAAR